MGPIARLHARIQARTLLASIAVHLLARVVDRIIDTMAIRVVGVIPRRNARARTGRARVLIRASPHVLFFVGAPHNH